MFRCKTLTYLTLSAALSTATITVPAQISINIGAAPDCPYGYYDYAQYDCSPYGYYGPDWFNGGAFVGAGPWFRGRPDFYGHVDNRYDPRYGYAGPRPDRGDRPFDHFHGNEARDGRGHIGDANHDVRGEHNPGFQGGDHPGGDNHGGGNHR